MITLFHREECPYCVKVRNALQELDVEWHSKPCKMGSKYREELQKLGGKQQVPFMVDGDTSMYESDDIVNYLQEKYS